MSDTGFTSHQHKNALSCRKLYNRIHLLRIRVGKVRNECIKLGKLYTLDSQYIAVMIFEMKSFQLLFFLFYNLISVRFLVYEGRSNFSNSYKSVFKCGTRQPFMVLIIFLHSHLYFIERNTFSNYAITECKCFH